MSQLFYSEMLCGYVMGSKHEACYLCMMTLHTYSRNYASVPTHVKISITALQLI